MQQQSTRVVLVAAAALISLAACSSSGGKPSAHPAPSTVLAPASTPAVVSGAAPTGTTSAATKQQSPVAHNPASIPPPTARPSQPSMQLPEPDRSDQACTPGFLLAYVRSEPDGPPSGFKDVKIYNCAHGYARIHAAPNPVTGQAVNGDQFFLQRTGDGWKTLARGLGLDCGDARPELAAACASFG